MKVTQLGYPRPVRSLSGALSGGSAGQAPVANGSNGVEWTDIVQRISANGSNNLMGPFVNFASGSNILLTLDSGPIGSAFPSNTVRIHGQAGATGVSNITSNGSNSLTGAIDLQAGTGIALGVSGQVITIINTGVPGPAGSGGSGGTFPLGLAAPDKIPASPGAMDEEWEGTADTLPTNWAWVSAAPTFSINSTMPSWFIIERSDTTERKLRRSSFTMAATSGLWIKFGAGGKLGISGQFEFIIYDSASSNGYGFGVHNGNVWLARDSNAGVLANRGTFTSTDRGSHAVMGVMRVSNTWQTWFSWDGINFFEIQSADTRTFTVDRLELRWSTDNAMKQRGIVDWIRYRTDNLFPKP